MLLKKVPVETKPDQRAKNPRCGRGGAAEEGPPNNRSKNDTPDGPLSLLAYLGPGIFATGWT
jgi:hypothetical protein